MVERRRRWWWWRRRRWTVMEEALEGVEEEEEVVRDLQVFSAVALPDTCYVLSFAVIMLNTSLHNPNVKDKPSVQRFTAMNRGINDGGDLPEDLLRVRGFF